jgi:methyltransferase family protein
MRWEVKAAIQGVLSRVPGGYRFHRWLQRVAGTDRLDIADEYRRKALFLRRLLDRGITLKGAMVLEIGTGWHPYLPLVLHLMDAERTVTVDVNPWLTRETLAETVAAVDSRVDRLASDFGVNESEARRRLAALRERARSGAAPTEVLLAAGVEYRFPMDAGDTGLRACGFDLVVSSNVFEHIPPGELGRIVTESRRLLRPGGVSAHHIHTGDHFSADERITSVNFLKYSPRTWRLIGSGLAYHNRLRCRDYVRLFEQYGFELPDALLETDERALAALRSGEVRPHERFRGYTDQELAEVLVDVFARVPVGAGTSD